MDDAELQKIRAARLAELQSQGGSGPGGAPSAADQSAQRDAEASNRHAMLSQILDSAARDRLRRIALVKPDRAQGVEDLIMRMAKSGQIRQRISEQELVGLLEEISGQQAVEKEKIGTIRNLRRADDSDDDWN